MQTLDTLLSNVRDLGLEARDRSRLEAPRVTQLLNFARGQQWDAPGQPPWYDSGPFDPDAEISRLNISRRLIAAFSSMVAGSVPGFTVSPGSTRPLARLQAKATGKIVAGLWKPDGYFPMDQRVYAMYLAAITGGCFAKVTWHPTKHRDRRGLIEGDIDVQVLSRNEVHPDPSARRWEDCSYIFETQQIPLARALTLYPRDIYGRPTGSEHFEREHEDLYQNQGWNYQDNNWTSHQSAYGTRNHRVEITKCWWRPDRQFPNGLFVAYSREPLAISPLPFEWPWVKIDGPFPSPNEFYNDGLLRDLEPVQRNANEIHGRIMEWLKRVSAPNLLAHKENKVSAADFTDMAGTVVEWSGNRPPPQYLNPPAPPGQMFDLINMSTEMMMKMGAISEINMGSVPTDDFSGRAVAILEDLQRSSHGDSFASFGRASMDILKKMLRIAQEFWPDGKTVSSIGSNGSHDVAVFRRSEFDADAIIDVQIGDGPKSPTAARAEKLELFTAGLYEDTPAAAKARSDILKRTDEPFAQRDLHALKAMREDVALFDYGHVPEVDDFDDHEAHYEEHEIALMTETDPERRRILAEHIMQHVQRMMPMMGPAPAMGAQAALPPGAESPMNGGIGDLEAMTQTGRSPGPTE